MENNIKISAACLTFRDGKVLLVRHTYGGSKGKYIFPGGYLEPGELLNRAAEREVFEESGVTVSAGDILAVRYQQGDIWCVFCGEYLSGEPKPDFKEIDDAVFMDIDEALHSEDVISTAKEILRAATRDGKSALARSEFVIRKYSDDKEKWQLYL